MARERWVNGNQIAYGSGSWYRFVIDREINGDTISIWWGVETPYDLYDSTNVGDTNVNGTAIGFSNVKFSHPSSGGVTWLRGEAFNVPRGSSISVSGYVKNLADFSGGGGQSSAWATYSNPALPPNQMAAPTVSNIGSTTHTVSWSAPGTNGAGVTGYLLEWYRADTGAGVTSAEVASNVTSYAASDFSPNTEYKVRVFAHSAAGNSAASAYTNFTQAVAIPTAPGAPTVARVSDTSHSLSWTRADQTEGPYASQQILRRQCVGDVWSAYSVLVSVAGSAVSYVDSTTSPNAAYQYQVRATNASGTATSGASGVLWTTPGPPVSAAAAKDALYNIVVSWAAPLSTPSASLMKYEVSESTDGGATWSVLATTAAGVTTWTHATPNAALPHTYRVRAIVAPTGLVGSGLASGYVTTNSVQLLTAPAAPTGLTSDPSGTANRDEPITLKWVHTPIDSTAQTAYRLRHRAVGATDWTTVGPISQVASVFTLLAGAYPVPVTAFEWQVQTKGLHADYSPWSAISTVQVSSAPQVAISSPAQGGVVGGISGTVTWVFSDLDGNGQGAWEATLVALNGAVLETRSGADASASTTFAYRLQETTYTIRVRVRDTRGLWSPADTVTVSVVYPKPPTPVITRYSWAWKDGTVELDFSVPAPAPSETTAVYLEVWRSIDDGALELLASNLPPETLTYVDFSPTVEGENVYVVQAVSSLPSASQSLETTVVTPGPYDRRPGVWLSGGPAFSVIGRLASEVVVDGARILERTLQTYAGRPLPVEHSGEALTETWEVRGVLNTRWSLDIDAADSPEDWIALGSYAGPHLLRAPALFGGATIYAYVSVDGPRVTRQKGGNVYEVSFTATRVAGS